MQMYGKSFSDAAGKNQGYRGLWVGNVAQPFTNPGGNSAAIMPTTLFRDMFLAIKKDDVLPNTVEVQAGVPFLNGSLSDQDGVSVPPDVIVTLTKPDGTVLSTETPIWSDDLMIHHDADGNLSGFMIKNPDVGTWTIATSVRDATEPNFQLFVSTQPAGLDEKDDIHATIAETFTEHFAAEDIDRLVAKHSLGSWACFWCRLGLWAIAAAIAVLIMAAMTYVTAQSAAIAGLAAALNVAAGAVLNFVRTLVAIAGAGIGWVVNQICAWSGVCSAHLVAGVGDEMERGALA